MNPLASLAEKANPILKQPYVRRVRRNHGLEHATIALLNEQNYQLSGRSSDSGFVVIGAVPTEKLEKASHDALKRMRNGESHLAIHPHCGTNLLTTATLGALVGAFSFAGRSRLRIWERLPTAIMLMMLVGLFGQPLGMAIQKHFTTDGDPGDLEIRNVRKQVINIPFRNKPITLHHVTTEQS